MGRRSKAEERKPEILHHAYEAAREYGISGLTLGNIAARMGVAPSLLTHYFPSKDDIVLGLIDYMMNRYDESLTLDSDSKKSASQRFEALLDARLWEYSRQAVDDAVWYEVYALSLRHPAIRARMADHYRRDRESIVRELTRLIPNPSRFTGEIESLAGVVIAMMEGIGYFAQSGGGAAECAEIAQVMKSMALDRFQQLIDQRPDSREAIPAETGNL